jgi:uncharacterized repeat protein (TIGR03803 family)
MKSKVSSKNTAPSLGNSPRFKLTTLIELLVVMCGFSMLPRCARGELSFQTVYAFGTSTGLVRFPNGALTQGVDGSLYGTATVYQTSPYGSSSSAAIFRLSPNGKLTNLHTFTYPSPSAYTVNRLLQSADGNFYSTADTSTFPTPPNPGSVQGFLFKMTPAGDLTVLTGFWGTNDASGAMPLGTLIQTADGTLMGTTLAGGTVAIGAFDGAGTVFEFRTEGVFSGLLSLPFAQTNGFGPRGGLIQARDGNFYGTTSDTVTGASSATRGTIFRISSQDFKTLFTFFGTNGAAPSGSLLQAQDGALYGTTTAGGLGYGTVFRITTNGVFTSLFSFSGANGSNPAGDLIQLSDGNLYGTTTKGGTNDSGTIFRITTNGILTTIFRFNTSYTGGAPQGGLCLAGDGNLYGTTSTGGYTGPPGYGGGGSIFRLVSSPVITPTIQSNGAVVLNWPSFTNAAYRVEYRTNGNSGNWLSLATNLLSTGSTISFTDFGAGDAQRFYRVVLLPH